MKIIISNSSKAPIYEQITNQIKEQIIKGLMVENEALPSIRSLARELNVSVITTKRSYDELERDGYIKIVPAKGAFVSSNQIEDLKEKKLRMIEGKLKGIVEESKVLDISKEHLIEIINLIY